MQEMCFMEMFSEVVRNAFKYISICLIYPFSIIHEKQSLKIAEKQLK